MTMDYLILVYNLRVQTQININYKIKKLFKNILSNMYIDFLFFKKKITHFMSSVIMPAIISNL